MLMALILTSYIHTVPLPNEYWDAYYAITGKDGPRAIVSTKCKPRFYFKEADFDEFCKATKEWLGLKVSFCLRTGMQTKERCMDIIEQNMQYREVWIWDEN